MGISKLPIDRWEQQTSKLTCSIFHSHWWTQFSSPDPPQAPNRCSFRDPTSVHLKISVLSFCVLFQHTRNRWESASWPAGFLQRSGRSLLWPPSRGFLLFPDTGLRVSGLLSSLPCLLNRNPAAAWMPEDLFLETEAGMWVERIWGVVGSIIIFFFSWGHPEL